MAVLSELSELELTALMSSKICHDIVGPVGAINNGLELLEEEENEQTRAYALQLIANSARSAAARLEFARLAYGASSGLGGTVDLGMAERIARGFVEEGKHKLAWQGTGTLPKNQARLLLMLLTVSMLTIPGGGQISLTMDVKGPSFEVRSEGKSARVPDLVDAIFNGAVPDGIDARMIIPYYAVRLATGEGMRLAIKKSGAQVVLTAAKR
jgi:histidine phosphotransferase ChpT